LVKTFLDYKEHEGSLPCSQGFYTGHYFEPVESSPDTVCSRSVLILSSIFANLFQVIFSLQDFRIKFFMNLPMCATCPAHLMPFHLNTLSIRNSPKTGEVLLNGTNSTAYVECDKMVNRQECGERCSKATLS